MEHDDFRVHLFKPSQNLNGPIFAIELQTQETGRIETEWITKREQHFKVLFCSCKSPSFTTTYFLLFEMSWRVSNSSDSERVKKSTRTFVRAFTRVETCCLSVPVTDKSCSYQVHILRAYCSQRRPSAERMLMSFTSIPKPYHVLVCDSCCTLCTFGVAPGPAENAILCSANALLLSNELNIDTSPPTPSFSTKACTYGPGREASASKQSASLSTTTAPLTFQKHGTKKKETNVGSGFIKVVRAVHAVLAVRYNVHEGEDRNYWRLSSAREKPTAKLQT